MYKEVVRNSNDSKAIRGIFAYDATPSGYADTKSRAQPKTKCKHVKELN